ncbi:hypothetical protein PR048_014152 [Dryococelus australis]|uniref:Mutator-like transposase domain-containing protein n=1 Tax=Dryococelus australis TaxID=614101 RepID=A0ABQ9HDJ8_9NEOP|nr:hypothetical protein PR048_014152 [Dryococelus australis]
MLSKKPVAGRNHIHSVANVLSGRRIVDIVDVFMQIQNEKHHGGTDCSFMDMDFVKEKVDGFHCTWISKCRVCNIVSEIMSENRETKDTYVLINESAILATGGGYSQLREFSAGVDMQCMTIDDAALKSMLDAAEEEKAIAIRNGNLVPMCTVSGGRWSVVIYKESLLEELVNPKFSKRFVKADIKYPIYITTAQ